jgi:hypothetical protein
MNTLTLDQINLLNSLKVKTYYTRKYSNDNLGNEINENVTFLDVLLELSFKDNKGFYNLIGVFDSIVRERIFEKMSKMLNVDYEVVFDMWLFGKKL